MILAWLKKRRDALHSASNPIAPRGHNTSAPPPISAPAGPLALYLAGQITAAEQAVLTQQSIEADDPDFILVQGLIALDKGLKADSLRVLERGVSLHPTNSEMQVALGRALALAGRGNAATAAFRRALAGC